MENFTGETEEQTGVQEKNPMTISMLINSVYYFIECVFILDFHNHYRLVALHGGRVLIDASYNTPRGARIAFSKLYGDKAKAWSREIKAQWSHFYDPDTRWLEEKTKDISPL
ncbi:MAG: hypothetical protein PVH61_04595 [Candidatus Aminicenantes bacterium]|jgi:hypothetical protein